LFVALILTLKAVFWTFNLSFNILASVLATFPNIGQIFAQFSGHSGCRTHVRFEQAKRPQKP
jgi:hypothetical protein